MRGGGARRRGIRRVVNPACLTLLVGLLGSGLTLAGCDFPADAGGTLERARAEGTIRAGFVLREPGNTEPHGSDAEAVAGWAAREGLALVWEGGAETAIVEKLKRRSLALAVGGFTTHSVWMSEVGVSLVIEGSGAAAEPLVVFVAPGENALLFSLDRFIGALPEPAR